MAGPTKEIIGLVILVLMILLVIAARYIWTGSRSRPEPSSPRGPGPGVPDEATRTDHVQSNAYSGGMVASAFGPTPVWAGGPPVAEVGSGVHASVGSGGGVPTEPAGPPGAGAGAPGSWGPRGSTSPPAGDQPAEGEPDEPVVPEHPGNEGRSGSGPPAAAPVVPPPGPPPSPIPDNHASGGSLVMHRSNLRERAAAEVPTDWLVVTPVELLGEPPLPATGFPPAPPPAPPEQAWDVPHPAESDRTGGAAPTEPEHPPLEREVLEPEVVFPSPAPMGANPFADPVGAPDPGGVDMPSEMLRDLLAESDDDTSGGSRSTDP